MFINIDKNQNKKVEELLEEGIANLKIENNAAYPSRTNNIYNYQNSQYNSNYLKNTNYNLQKTDNYNININERKKHNYIYYNGLNTDLIDNTIEALNTGLYNSDYNKNYEKKIIPNKNQNIHKKIKVENNKEKRINGYLQKEKDLNISIVNNDNKDINNININKTYNNVNNRIKIENYDEIMDENNYQEQIYNNIPFNINDNIENINNINIEKNNNNNIVESNNIEDSSKNIKSKKHRTKKVIRNYEWKEKYDEVKKLSSNVLKDLRKIQRENKNLEKRLEKFKNNSENVNVIKSNLLKMQINFDKINNRYKTSENIRMRQIELIEKITKEMKNVEQLLFKEKGFK